MLQTVQGNLLSADAEALVNAVNTVGVMGKGIALQFKQAFPDNFGAYKHACDADEVVAGKMFVFTTERTANPQYIINFPTKRHWRTKSRLNDIKSGLVALVREVRERDIKSVAIPPLGCGHGGLDWNDVRPLIVDAFERLPDVAKPSDAEAQMNSVIKWLASNELITNLADRSEDWPSDSDQQLADYCFDAISCL